MSTIFWKKALTTLTLVLFVFMLSSAIVASAMDMHTPIAINGNSEFTAENGVSSGTGTQEDPYIMENLEISASTNHGILIINTDAYFVVRNCIVGNGGLNYYGIFLNNVTNGKIENCTVYNSTEGIYLYINCFNNTLTGNIVYNNSYGIDLFESTSNTITDNTVYNNNYDGVYLSSSSNNILMNNIAHDNPRDGIHLFQSYENILSDNTAYNNIVDGINLYNSSSNTIAGNSAYNNEDDGIYLIYSSINILSGNTVFGNLFEGIVLVYSPGNTLTENIAYNNAHGIYLWSSSGNTLTSNTLHNNNPSGIYFGSSPYNALTDNEAYNNTIYGIHLDNSNNTIMTSNVINNNEKGVYIEGSTGTQIHDCDIFNNTQHGVFNYDSDSLYVIDAIHCYWGSLDGPGGVGTGTGDKITTNVLYEPWLSPVKLNATLTIQSYNTSVVVGTNVTLFGELSPGKSGNVTIYMSFNDSDYVSIGNATLLNGDYVFPTQLNNVGTYDFYASWAGTENYNPSTSDLTSVFASAGVGIEPLWYVVIAGVVIVVIALVIYLMRKK